MGVWDHGYVCGVSHKIAWIELVKWVFLSFGVGQHIFNVGEKFDVGSLEYKLLRKPQ